MPGTGIRGIPGCDSGRSREDRTRAAGRALLDARTIMPHAPLADDGSAAWPLGRITDAAASVTGDQRRCVVLTTGALSPTHRGHVALLAAARTTLESKGWAVLGGFLSPSHDLYVGPKAAANGSSHANAAHRVAIAELVAAERPWIEVATWEARQAGRWPDFPVVAADCAQTLARRKARLGEVSVFYVCGVDHFRKCGLHLGLSSGRLGVVVVPRAGAAVGTDKPDKGVFWAESPAEVQDFSSTKVREALRDTGSKGSRGAKAAAAATQMLTHMLGEAAFAYVREHGLYHAAPAAAEGPSEAAKAAAAVPAKAAAAAPPPPQPPPAADPRTVFISLSALLRHPWSSKLSTDPRLPTALFFFGSKRKWIFPSTDAERQESADNNPAYLQMSQEMRECILRKEAEGLVFWLKPDSFVYDGGLYSGDPTAFSRASAWLQALHDPLTRVPYSPLKLDPAWWRAGSAAASDGGGGGGGFDRLSAKYTRDVERVIKNFQNGAHDYDPVCELLVQSNPNLLPCV